MNYQQSGQLITFIHLLRGLAPLLVLVAHLGGWWLIANNQTSGAWDIFQKVIVQPFHLYQNGGHLGVVLFFLISGFIISHVAERETRTEFAIKRFFRIAPTLWIGVALMALASGIAAQAGLKSILGDHSVRPLDYFLSAGLLDFAWYGRSASLSVTWTLFVEAIFYIVVGAMLPRLRSHPVRATVEMSCIFFLMMLPHKVSETAAQMMYFTIYLPLLVIGRCFYLRFAKRISLEQMWMLVATNFFIFTLFYTSRFPFFLQQGVEPLVTYLLAIAIFYSAMLCEIRRIPAFVSFFADISYALYIVHLPVGMLALDVLDGRGIPFALRFALASVLSVCVAAAITYAIERPIQSYARRLVARSSDPANDQAAPAVT